MMKDYISYVNVALNLFRQKGASILDVKAGYENNMATIYSDYTST